MANAKREQGRSPNANRERQSGEAIDARAPDPVASADATGANGDGSQRPVTLRPAWWSAAALALVVALVFGNAVRGDLVMDGAALVLGNPAIRSVTWENVRTIWSQDYWQPLGTNGLFRPVTTLSFMLNWAVLGHAGWAPGYRALNVALHAGCGMMLAAVLRGLAVQPRAALAAGIVFAVHPISTDVVPNVAGRADLLATLAVLIGVWAQTHALATTATMRWRWTGVLALAALVAVFSKESGVVLAPVVVAQAWGHGRSAVIRTAAAVGPAVIAMALARWGLWASGYPAEVNPIDNPLIEIGWVNARLTALQVLGRAVALLVWPAHLVTDYSFDQTPLVGVAPVDADAMAAILLGAGVIVLGSGLLWRYRREPAVAVPLLLGLIALVPTANLVVLIGSIRADRFLYLPLAGFAGALVPALLRRTPQWGALAVAIVVVACAARTITRNPVWVSDEALWAAMVRDAPRNAKAHKGRAASLWATRGLGAIDDVITEAERAVAIRPDYLPALVDLGTYYLARGDRTGGPRARFVEAAHVLKRARQWDALAERRFVTAMTAKGHRPDTIPPYGNRTLHASLAVVAGRLDRPRVALRAFEEVLRLDPWAAGTYVDLAGAHVDQHDRAGAARALHAALALDPTHAEAQARLRQLEAVFGRLVVEQRCAALAYLASVFERARLAATAASFRTLRERECVISRE